MNSSRRRAAIVASSLLLGLVLPATPAHSKAAATPVPTKTTTTPAPAKPAPAKPAPAKPAPAKPAPAKAAAETAPTLATRMAAVKTAKTLNYYPSNAGWSAMWTNWNPTKVDTDLARAATLGATNVRVILFPQSFGYPTPKAEYMDRLAKFVSLAAARGMTVKFTMFDWWEGYDDFAGSIAWATAVLKPYKDDKRLISVELKNEFDPADTAGVAWARKMIPAVRAVAPTMPLTFSVDGVIGSAGMAKIKSSLPTTPLDFYDFHFYGNSERALANIRRAQAAVAPTPVVIGEVGLNTLQNTEGEQAAFLARVFEAAKIAGVQSVAPWTLNDFAAGAIPTSQVSKIPAQYTYGLYRTDGTAKPAVAVVKAEWTGTALPTDLLDNSFEATAGQGPWRPYLPELGFGVKTQAAARTGKWAISFTNTGKSAAGSPSYRVAPITPVQSAQKWRAEVWARGSGATGATQIALSWFDINDKWLGGVSSPVLPTGSTGWTKLTTSGAAPAGSASMQVHLKSADNDGTVWFDDVAIANS
ncbi:cellulase family glycosylhydrolase [Micromonosporaceae bacterium Da 78-11]